MAEEMEKKAKAMGWVPEDEFRGDPEKWVDAETFVSRGENLMPVMRENLDRALKKIESLEGTIRQQSDNLKKQGETFQKFQEFASKAEERAYTRALKEYESEVRRLRSQYKRAAREQDLDLMDEIESRIDTIQVPEKLPEPVKEIPAQPSNAAPEPPPEFKEWKDVNKWYGEDFEMSAYADGVGQFIQKARPGINATEHLKLVTEEVKKRFPDKFENPNKAKPSSMEGPGEPELPPGRRRTFADLPPEAKKAYEEFHEQMPSYKKEDYARQYWGE